MAEFTEKSDLSILAKHLKKRVNGLLVVYGLLIIGTIILFLIVLGLCGLAVWGMLESGRIYGRAIVFIIGAIVVAGICMKVVLQPLFKIFEPKKNTGKEIKREEYPELFALIDEVVEKVDCLQPKHVYLSDECNAYVGYPSILGYLSHGAQNLTIGIPLLYGLNKTEFKSILSHEFGHFTQKSTSINSVANLSEYICGAIAQSQEAIEQSDDDSYEAKARVFARMATKIMLKQYHKVAPLNGILSRAQEYDADKHSYEVVGTDGSISALCKIQSVAGRWDGNYLRWLWQVIGEKRCPADVRGLFEKFSAGFDDIGIKPLVPASHYKPIPGEYDSRISSLENTDTHPSTEKRCNAIASYPVIETVWNNEAAYDYFPKAVIDEMYGSVVTNLEKKRFPSTTEFLKKDVQDDELLSLMKGGSYSLLDYFYCDSVFYEEGVLNEVGTNPENIPFPFTRRNGNILRQYYTAKDDLQTLEWIIDENKPQRQFLYNGKEYCGTNVPIEEHRAYYAPLYEEAKNIAVQSSRWFLWQLKGNDPYLNCLRDMSWVKQVDIKLKSGIENMKSVYHIWKAMIKSTKAMEFVNSMETGFREIVGSYFTKDENGESRFDRMWAALGMPEKDKEPAVSFMDKEKRDSIEEFYNVYNLVGVTFENYFKYTWGILKRDIIMPEFQKLKGTME